MIFILSLYANIANYVAPFHSLAGNDSQRKNRNRSLIYLTPVKQKFQICDSHSVCYEPAFVFMLILFN
jgi:hypothetical protein